jgi:hypothetical protein
MMFATEFEKIPECLRATLREDVEGSVEGVRWVGNDHMVLAVAGGTWAVLPGKVGFLLKTIEEDRGVLGAYHVKTNVRGALPKGCSDGPEFSTAGHYCVQWPCGIAIALYYMAIVHHLFGAVEWRGAGVLDPVTAHVDGKIVAVVMPVRSTETDITLGGVEAGQGARP